jgi:hypothetical protein
MRMVLMVLIACVGLAVPWYEASGQATPTAPPGVTARTTALLVSAIRDPLRVTGSDGLVHLEYDLVLTSVFTAPVRLLSIEVLTPDGRSVHRLSGDTLRAGTQPLLGDTPTDAIPASGAVAVLLDVVVPQTRSRRTCPTASPTSCHPIPPLPRSSTARRSLGRTSPSIRSPPS